MASRFILNETSYHGAGAIKEIATETKARGFKKAFVCSDADLIQFGVTKKVLDVLEEAKIAYTVYSDIKNPSKHMNFYKHKFAYYGRKIKFFKDGKKLPGKIVDVDKKNCALIIEDAKGHSYSISSPSGIIFSRRLNINSLMKRK